MTRIILVSILVLAMLASVADAAPRKGRHLRLCTMVSPGLYKCAPVTVSSWLLTKNYVR